MDRRDWNLEMNTTTTQTEQPCREHLERFFGQYPDGTLNKRAMKALRLIAASGEPMPGRSAGWAAGIVYYLVNQCRQSCGVPGLLNSEFESIFGVTMSTIRKRAARIEG